MRNEKGDITTDTAGIHRILKYYYEPLIVNKLYNLGKTVTVLEKHNLLRLNQEEIENQTNQ